MKCLCKHGEGTLTLGQGGACSVLLKGIDSASDHVSEFKSTGTGQGGGRIRRVPISFANYFRKLRKDAVSPTIRAAVRLFVERETAVSPCTKDRVRKRVAPQSYIVRQARVLLSTQHHFYESFKASHPSVTIGSWRFRKLLNEDSWELRSARVESCLCKNCENFLCYEEALTEETNPLWNPPAASLTLTLTLTLSSTLTLALTLTLTLTLPLTLPLTLVNPNPNPTLGCRFPAEGVLRSGGAC
jgi:hypothetical protein